MTRRQQRTARQAAEGFTAAVCRSEDGCGAADDRDLEALRAATRKVPLGLLVATGCLGRHLYCPHHEGNQVARAGHRVVVQPCTRDRTPLGPALAFGPFTDPAQAEALAAWLAEGMGRGRRPPRHLLAVRPSHSTE
ncbi:hypothetical protein SSP24_65900 [Streptomyces spinoverrucosus]|uniref:Uncharacterized protein n=1 Tax=Streptomyces spinoverrucosus TaxID=284043 RepID=A0A4Y3VSC8_9ACTN|nr:hypothetical protein [Streptomyces spinoverrucosus]GEC08935.1 hypothetical protein SSP24_65900 [Streptomyces spinoverrucosus]GHB92980.1 hypothetical protein GCM10010397_76920 [Streptomyces spinoverrucosus]